MLLAFAESEGFAEPEVEAGGFGATKKERMFGVIITVVHLVRYFVSLCQRESRERFRSKKG